MGLKKKIVLSKLPSFDPVFQQILQEYDEKLKNGELGKSLIQRNPSLLYRIMMAKNPAERDALVRVLLRHNPAEDVRVHRFYDAQTAASERPNFFVTLSMPYCHSSKWCEYDRDYHVKKLYRLTMRILKNVIVDILPETENLTFEAWPYFAANMEHFDDMGNVVAPHMHVLLKLNVDKNALENTFKKYWNKYFPQSGPNDIDVKQLYSEKDIQDRCRYFVKNSHQDHLDRLSNGVRPSEICYRYGWSAGAIAHDQWAIRRENFRSANAKKWRDL